MLSDYLEWRLRKMTKNEFYKVVTDIINNSNLDVVQHYTICLFSDKLWSKISELQNDIQQAEYKKAKKLFFKKNKLFLHFSQIMFVGSVIDTMWECIEQVREESLKDEKNK